MTIDLPAYLDRIRYLGSTEPSLPVLRALQLCHLSRIPFECIDPFLGVPIDIDPGSVQRKLVRDRRGGYCQEHNALFHDVLATLGFSVAALGGRVLFTGAGQPGPMTMTHRLTLVELPEGQFVADVGFGGQSPTAPLRLQPDLEQSTPFGSYRVASKGTLFDLELKHATGWRPLYRFNLEGQSRADFEVANWFTSTHPRSRFTQNLIVCGVMDDRRVNLLNTNLSVRHIDGNVEQRTLRDEEDFTRVLRETMGLPSSIETGTLWAKLPK